MVAHIVEGEVVYSFEVKVAHDPRPYWVVIEARRYQSEYLEGAGPYYVWTVYRGSERYEAQHDDQRAPRIDLAASMAITKIVNWDET